MKRGAVDYLSKPFDIDEMTFAVREALARRHLADQLTTLRAHSPAGDPEPPTWPSMAMRQVMTLAERAAKRSSVVLLLGESGTGKNWLSRHIHRHSPRADGPYFTVNCATVSRDLAESEMFGHEPGAFTGSRGRKRGLMELADGGTLVLDEIGDMDPTLQAKLLTFLDTQTFVRVGGEENIRIDTRIFACTNVDIEARVKAGGFRQDLFYRLNVLPIRLPPLRERVEDLPILAAYLLERLSNELRMSPRARLSPEAEARLVSYPWPGNIRELRNVLERALILSHDGQIRADDLPLPADGPSRAEWVLQVRFPQNRSLHAVTADVARNLIKEALRRAGTKQEAAALLGLSRHALAHQLKSLGLEEEQDIV
jgi:DNA-binding NtrC family response regulator